jgi:D-alanyl-lipoteichoic acid acyltransferase DltB (MBOAT superfamily)
MVFNSFTFALFFAVVLVFHYSAASWRAKKIFLTVASYLFYAAWNPPFVLLLFFSTIADWELAKRIYRASSQQRRRAWMIGSLCINLGVLGFFKYSTFLLDSFTALIAQMGVVYQPPALDIILPVGISFYTFQTLSYTLDVYRNELKPWHSFTDYALFVAFFPQLVAGPIVRAEYFLPQTEAPSPPSRDRFLWGSSLIVVGLFQKVVIADSLLAPVVEKVYDGDGVASPVAASIGTLAFSGQIFCDFAGYSTIAIGAATCLGFALPDNFRFPYAAIGFSDFWRRWHMSLSTWLRDYLYIGLGGNRRGPWRTYRNLALTMLLGGLWHGASWTFVAWGGLHGCYLVVERGLHAVLGSRTIWRHWSGQLLLAGATFACVSLAWVLFRADSFGKAADLVAAMLQLLPSYDLYVTDAEVMVTIGVVGALLAVHWLLRNTTLEAAAASVPVAVRTVLVGLMAVAIALTTVEDRAFIYFQF